MFFSFKHCLLASLLFCGISWHCFVVLGMTQGLFGNHLVSTCLKGATCAPLRVLVVLFCSAYRVSSCCLHFLGSPPYLHLFYTFIHCPHSNFPSILSIQCDGCWGWVFLAVGVVAGLQGGQALRCSSCLGLGSGVPAPMFLGSQPPYATKTLPK